MFNKFLKLSLIIKISLLIILTQTFSGCTTTKCLGNGEVSSVLKLKDKTYVPTGKTDEGALIGGGTGLATGAAVGTGAGLAFAASTCGFGIIFLPVFIAGGAMIGGIGGLVVGSGTGYAYGVHEQGIGLFDYVIQPSYQKEKILIQQYSQKRYKKNDKVKIMKEGKRIYIV
jgi:hypothetical protein